VTTSDIPLGKRGSSTPGNRAERSRTPEQDRTINRSTMQCGRDTCWLWLRGRMDRAAGRTAAHQEVVAADLLLFPDHLNEHVSLPGVRTIEIGEVDVFMFAKPQHAFDNRDRLGSPHEG
jgi:hypothetical protein